MLSTQFRTRARTVDSSLVTGIESQWLSRSPQLPSGHPVKAWLQPQGWLPQWVWLSSAPPGLVRAFVLRPQR
eukprot:2149892-Amphidinium_carterae.1